MTSPKEYIQYDKTYNDINDERIQVNRQSHRFNPINSYTKIAKRFRELCLIFSA